MTGESGGDSPLRTWWWGVVGVILAVGVTGGACGGGDNRMMQVYLNMSLQEYDLSLQKAKICECKIACVTKIACTAVEPKIINPDVVTCYLSFNPSPTLLPQGSLATLVKLNIVGQVNGTIPTTTTATPTTTTRPPTTTTTTTTPTTTTTLTVTASSSTTSNGDVQNIRDLAMCSSTVTSANYEKFLAAVVASSSTMWLCMEYDPVTLMVKFVDGSSVTYNDMKAAIAVVQTDVSTIPVSNSRYCFGFHNNIIRTFGCAKPNDYAVACVQ